VIGRFRTIRVRLMLGFGLVIIALFGAGVVGIQALDSLQDGLRDRIGEVATVGDRLFLSHDATLRTVALAQADLMAGQGGSRAKIDSLTQLSDSIRRLVVTESALGTAERQRLEEIGALQARIDVRLSVARAYRDVGRVDDAFRMANLATLTLDTLLTESAALSADQVDRTAVTVAAVEELVAARRRLLSVLLLLGLVAAVAFGHTTWRSITRPLDGIVHTARTLGQGHLLVNHAPEQLDEEYQVVADALAETAAHLRTVVQQIQDEARVTSEAAEGLRGAAGQAARSSGELSTVVASIARDAESQRNSVTASKASAEEVEQSTRMTEQSAARAVELGRSIKDTAIRTQEEIDGAIASLRGAQTVIAESSTRVSGLVEVSRAVGEFVRVIRNIAGQTELLALNAAIEAARAGHHGRGFAVVAQEVRKLAADSTVAAEEVDRVMRDAASRIEQVIAGFERGVTGLGDIDATSRRATAALHTIGQSVTQVDLVAGAVGEAARASRTALARLSELLQRLEDEADAQAAASEEAAAATQQSAASSQQVAATAEVLQQSAKRLNDLVSRFKA
jgi:methyl-accepting chemotaxis protein